MVKKNIFKVRHSIRHPNAINELIYIPALETSLGNRKWRFYGSF